MTACIWTDTGCFFCKTFFYDSPFIAHTCLLFLHDRFLFCKNFLLQNKQQNAGGIINEQNTKETRHFINHTCHRFGIYPAANAMHIMEGYLPVTYCIAWGILCIPFLIAGFFSLKKTIQEHRKNSDPFSNGRSLRLCFICPENPICHRKQFSYDRNRTRCDLVRTMCHRNFRTDRPPISGSTSRSRRSYDTWSKYIFHGNRGPLLTFGIYKLCQKLKLNRMVTIFLAASLGDLFTYCITSFQLALAYPSEVGGFSASLVKFMGIFAATQVPLAIIEGLLTVVVIMSLESYAKSELSALGYFKGGAANVK